MPNYITEPERERLEKIFNDGAARVEEWPEHWVCGGDGGISYCLECCEKEVKRLAKKHPGAEFSVDGGFGAEGDSQAVCEDCHKLLDNSFTTTACTEEIRHFLDHKFDPKSDDDCLSLSKVILSAGWDFSSIDKQDFYASYGLPESFYDDLHKLCRGILGKLDKAKESPCPES